MGSWNEISSPTVAAEAVEWLVLLKFITFNKDNSMKTIALGLILSVSVVTQPPSLLGKWQLVKQTTCIESEIETDEEEDALVSEMQSRGAAKAQIVHFKDNNSVDETTRIISRRKSYNSKALLYRFDGETLHFLDKRSRTILESYIVEKVTRDSLIISNSARACDTKIFMKIK